MPPRTPRTDCRNCAHFDPPSDLLGSAWCRVLEQTVVRAVGRCGAYEGPPSSDLLIVDPSLLPM